MNQGLSLVDLAKELERQNLAKQDFLAPSRLLQVEPNENGRLMMNVDRGSQGIAKLQMKPLAEDQLREWAEIPSKYYGIMRSKASDLLVTNVNHWLNAKNQPRLVRCLDAEARAFLSNRYRTIDNFDIAQAALPILINDGQVEVVSSQVTDGHLYIKAVTKRLEFEVKPGDFVQAGISISNSEVGLGSVKVEPLLYRLICKNGAIVNDLAMKRYHVGRYTRDLDEYTEIYRDSTRRMDDAAFMMKLQDTVRAAFDEVQFNKLRGIMVDSTTRRITAPLDTVIDKVVEKFDIREKERSGLLMQLVEGGDGLTQWGLANAITFLANTEQDYERSTELERIGGEVITLEPIQWQKLAEVA
ncbi:MAG TPA: DUF932 domain-containing protein [Firmicutes bacterium]|jgi:hypothetical protein|nr:DUF932 domain-containing protein [Bacillota bacterium]